MPKSTGRKRTKREAEQRGLEKNADLETQGHQNVGHIERILSSILGGIMLIGGLSRRSIPGLVFAATGAALLYRGATGQCKVYKSLGLDTNLDIKNSDRTQQHKHGTTRLADASWGI